jgi:YggT family protein
MLVLVISAIRFVVYLFFATLIGRLILDWIQVLAREWRPRGPVLLVAEVVYTVTDPPLKFLRRLIPPLSLGGIRLDLAFIVLMLAVTLALRLLDSIQFS